MSPTHLLVAWLQTGMCLAAAWLILKLVRRSLEARILVCRTALVLGIALFTVSPFVSIRQNPVIPIQVASPLELVEEVITPPLPYDVTAPVLKSETMPTPTTRTVPPLEAVPAQSIAIDWPSVGVNLYGIGFLCAVGLIGFGYLSLRRLTLVSYLVSGGPIFDALSEICQRNSVPTPRLYACRRVGAPFVTGLRRQRIYFPHSWLTSHDADMVRAVLEHEVSHIAARDLVWLFLGRLACAILWCQPLAWVLYRHMRLAAEELCDQRVLSAGVSIPVYARVLLSLRETVAKGRMPGPAIGAMNRDSYLAHRIKMILASDSRKPKSLSSTAKRLTAGSLIFCSIASAILVAQPSPDEISGGLFGNFKGPHEGEVRIRSKDRISSAWFVTIPWDTAHSPAITKLTLNGNLVKIPALPVSAIGGTLVVKTAKGAIDFEVLWPADDDVKSITIKESITVRGKVDLKALGINSGRIKVVRILKNMSASDSPGRSAGQILQTSNFSQLNISSSIDKNGNFEIAGLPRYSTICLEIDNDKVAQDFRGLAIQVDQEGNYKPISYTPKLGGSIEGQVLQKGMPIAGLKIVAHGIWGFGLRSGTTDANGRYRIPRLDADTYTISATIPFEDADKYTIEGREGVTVQSGAGANRVDFNATIGGVVSGTVSDSSGKALANSWVCIYGPAHPRSASGPGVVKTDSNGSFTSRVPAGKNFVFSGAGHHSKFGVDVQVKDGEESKVKLVVPLDPNSGHVVFDLGVPEAYMPVRFKNGATVKVEYLFNRLGNEVYAWLPDGSPTQDKTVLNEVRSNQNINQPVIKVGCKLQVTDAPYEPLKYLFKVTSTLMTGASIRPSSERNTDVVLFLSPPKADTGTIRLGLPFGPYRQWENPEFKTLKNYPDGKSVSFETPPELIDKDVVVTGIDSTGKAWEGLGLLSTSGALGQSTKILHFPSVKPIVSIEVKYRDYEWVAIKGVHLTPKP